MANFNLKRVKELSENQKAAAGFIKFFVFVIIIGVVIYSEYMFIGIISVILPDGLNKALALVGAVATGASVLALVAAKMLWVTPGGQMIWAWIFTGIEIVIMIMNDMLAYNLHQGNVDGPLAAWQAITPASPVMALIGWMILLFLDRAQRDRHKDMEMQAKKADSEREYLAAAHEAEMDLRHNHLNQVTGRLQEVLQSEAIQIQIMRHAEQMVARVLTDVSGISAMPTSSQQQPPALPAPRQQASFAQQAPTPKIPDVMSSSNSTPVQPVDNFRKLYEDYKNDPSLRATIGFDTYLEQVEKAQKVNGPLTQPQMTPDQASQAGMNGHQN